MKTLRRAAISVCVSFLVAAGAVAQTPPRDQSRPATPASGTATISGVVTIAGTTQPAARARVSLGGMESGGRNTTADELGRFSFTALAAGRYSLSASKVGYLGASYGQSRPGRPGTPIQLAEGQRFAAAIQMYKGGVLTGVILDEHGEAIPGTPVRVMRWNQQSGQRVLQPAGGDSADDRGIYRVYGLQPGDYIVSATPRNALSESDRARQELESIRQTQASGRLDETQLRDLAQRAAALEGQIAEEGDEEVTGYAPVYFPGTTAPTQAGAVALGAGEERAGLDFQLLRVPVARVEGTVVNGTGQALPNIQVTLLPSGGGFAADATGARADAEGRFRLLNVAPGSYTLAAMATINAPGQPPARGAAPAPRPDPLRFWAVTEITVDGRNVSNVALSLQPGMTVSGRIAFEGATPQPSDLTRVRVTVAPADPGAPRTLVASAAGRVDASGRFTITNVVPGRYRLSGGAGSSGWSVKSSVIDGQDSLDDPVEVKPGQNVAGAVITFTDRQTEVSGTITDDRGRPATACTIVAYSTDRGFWVAGSRRIRTARPATDGSFSFTNLPPGEYRLAPANEPDPGAWFDPAFLQQLDSGSVRVTIGEGEKKTVSLRVGGGG